MGNAFDETSGGEVKKLKLKYVMDHSSWLADSVCLDGLSVGPLCFPFI